MQKETAGWRWPNRLLTQNGELRKVGVWNWTIPAHVIRLPDGRRFNCCPNAGSCGTVCYAKFGAYLWPNVRHRHEANLFAILSNPSRWERQMVTEIQHERFNPSGRPHDLWHDPADEWMHWWITVGGKAVRIHDAGDFFSPQYFDAWCRIAEWNPDRLLYAYTKEVSMVLARWEQIPPNFRIVFSFGGREDHLIDRAVHRHADVFPSSEALELAGYFDQEDNDLLAVTAPVNRIGIVQNNIPVAIRRFDGRAMSEMRPVAADAQDA